MIALSRHLADHKARLAGHAFTLAVLGVWALYALFVESYVMPGPWEVALRAFEFFGDVHLLKHMLYSFAHIAAAIAVSFFVGSGLALLPFYVPAFGLMVDGRATPFLNSFSGIGWTLLAIVWFGINHFTVVFAISMVLIPFAVINLREGLHNLDRELLEMATSFSRSRWLQFRRVILPSLYPFIFATLRISFGVAWKVTLTAELFGGNAGLGYLLNLARQKFDTPLILVVILIIIAFVYSTERWIFRPVQAMLTRHHVQAD